MDSMTSQDHIAEHATHNHLFKAEDVFAILRDHGWLAAEPSAEQVTWADHAAALLGPHAADKEELAALLQLVFHYDAQEILQSVDAHAALSRYAARDVIRALAIQLLVPDPFTSDRFKEAVTILKETLDVRSRDLFHPIRLALAGRIGEGELDRVILLLDEAAALPFAVPVKPVRTRILEFCAALE